MKKTLLLVLSLFVLLLSAPVAHSQEVQNSENNYLVEFDFPKISKENKSELKAKSEKVSKLLEKDATIIKRYENFPFILIKTDEKTVNKLKKEEGIITVEEDKPLQLQTDGYPGITTYCSACDSEYLTSTLAQALLNQGYTGKGVNVAVMDTGVVNYHQEFNLITEIQCYEYSGCYDSTGDTPYNSHGTGVAGVIASKGIRVRGIAPGVNLYSIKFGAINAANNWRGNESSFISGIDWAISNGIHIINMSFGLFNDWSSRTEDILYKAQSRTYNDYGILMIAAAGNNGTEPIDYPGSSDYVLAITNYDSSVDRLNGGSSYGDGTSFAAPGTNIYVPTWDSYNSYGHGTGTSYSAPIVTGIAALLREKFSSTNQNVTNTDLIQYMQFMAKKVAAYDGDYNEYVGYGLIQGEIGNSISEQITINNTSYLYNMPSAEYKLSLNLGPQTLNAIREYNGWFEVQTWVGYRWICPSSYFINDFKITLIQSTTNLYDSPNGNFTGATLSPQTVTAIKRSGDWFQIHTWLGDKWIKPYSYSYSE